MTRLLLLLPFAMTCGCSYYHDYGACDLKCTHQYPLTHEAVRALPCGPDPIGIGYRPTTWSEWPGKPSAAPSAECVQQDESLSLPLVAPAEGDQIELSPVEAPSQLPEAPPFEPPAQAPAATPADLPTPGPEPTPAEPLPQLPQPTLDRPLSIKPELTEQSGVALDAPRADISLAAAIEHQPAAPIDEADSSPTQWQPDNAPALVIPVIVDDEQRETDTSLKDRRDRVDATAVDGAAEKSQAQQRVATDVQRKPRSRHHAAKRPPSLPRSLRMHHYAPRRHATLLR